MSEKPRLTRQAMCDRLAMECQDGWIVNLGVGMPTLCSNYVDLTKELIFHSEDGVIGYGPLARPDEVDRHLVNAGGRHATAAPGWSPEEIQELTEARLSIADDLREFRFRDQA